MIRRYTLSLLFAFFLCFSGLSFAQNAEQTLLSGLPAQYTGFQAQPVVDYGKPALGYSRSYKDAKQQSTITVYLFNMGKARIAGGMSDPAVLEAYRNAQLAIEDAARMGIYSQLQLLKKYTVTTNRSSHSGKNLTFSAASYRYQMPNRQEPVYSRVYVSGVHNLIFKMRITQAENGSYSEAQIQEFLTMVIKNFDENR